MSLAEVLGGMEVLRELQVDLYNNLLGDTSVIAFARGLGRMEKLGRLDLDLSRNTAVGPAGIEALVQALRELKGRRLHDLSLSLKHVTLGTRTQQSLRELQGLFHKA